MDDPNGSAQAKNPKIDFVNIEIDRETGAVGVASNMKFITDQLGLLEFARQFIVDKWKHEQALAVAQQRQSRIVPGNTLPIRRN